MALTCNDASPPFRASTGARIARARRTSSAENSTSTAAAHWSAWRTCLLRAVSRGAAFQKSSSTRKSNANARIASSQTAIAAVWTWPPVLRLPNRSLHPASAQRSIRSLPRARRATWTTRLPGGLMPNVESLLVRPRTGTPSLSNTHISPLTSSRRTTFLPAAVFGTRPRKWNQAQSNRSPHLSPTLSVRFFPVRRFV